MYVCIYVYMYIPGGFLRYSRIPCPGENTYIHTVVMPDNRGPGKWSKEETQDEGTTQAGHTREGEHLEWRLQMSGLMCRGEAHK